MMHHQVVSLVCVVSRAVAVLLVCSAAHADDPSDDVRAAVERSLPYLWERGEWWITQKDCVSCHRVSFQVWTHALAAERGFEVDRKQVNRVASWCIASMSEKDDADVETGLKNADGAAQLLAAFQVAEWLPERDQASRRLLQWISDTQQEDGSWKPAGQLPLQKRKKEETAAVSTMWNTYFGAIVGLSGDAVQKALEFSSRPMEAESTEWLLTRALLQHRLGHLDQMQKTLENLLAEQNADGGWGWLRRQASDPMATGQVVWAICQIDRSTACRGNLDRAVSWLIAAQEKDGSWPTKGTKRASQKRQTETATYWGSAWATLGLLQTIPAGEQKSAKAVRPTAVPGVR